MPQLSNSKLVVLTAACQRPDRCVFPVTARLKGNAAGSVLKSLLNKGLIKEVRAKRDDTVWRPGHSQLRKAWSDFRDVAHLMVAGACLAHEGLAKAAAHEPSILNAIWIAPDAVLALASGFQQFGLQPKPVRKESPTLRPDKVWRIPPRLVPKKPFVVVRRLTEEQLGYLRTRRASKRYIPATVPGSDQ